MTEPAAAVLVSGPVHRAALLGAALGPYLAAAGVGLRTLPCSELVDRTAPECTVAGLAAALAADLAARAVPVSVIGDGPGAAVVVEMLAASPAAATHAVLSGARPAATALERILVEEIRARPVPGDVAPRGLALLRAGQLLGPARLSDDARLAALLRDLRRFEREDAADVAVLEAALAHRTDASTLAAVTTPCLVLAHTDDPVTPPHLAQEVATGLPRGELVTIPCGHGGAVDDPESVGPEIARFLARPVPVPP